MQQSKIKQLLDRSRNIKSVFMQTHDMPLERNNFRREIKQVIDTTNPNKNYVVCVFEV